MSVERVIHTEAKETVPADVFIEDAPAQIVKLFGDRELLVPSWLYNAHLAADSHFTHWDEVPERIAAVSARKAA